MGSEMCIRDRHMEARAAACANACARYVAVRVGSLPAPLTWRFTYLIALALLFVCSWRFGRLWRLVLLARVAPLLAFPASPQLQSCFSPCFSGSQRRAGASARMHTGLAAWRREGRSQHSSAPRWSVRAARERGAAGRPTAPCEQEWGRAGHPLAVLLPSSWRWNHSLRVWKRASLPAQSCPLEVRKRVSLRA